MKSNDLSTIWILLKKLRDLTTDPLLSVVLELTMFVVIIERENGPPDTGDEGDPRDSE